MRRLRAIVATAFAVLLVALSGVVAWFWVADRGSGASREVLVQAPGDADVGEHGLRTVRPRSLTVASRSAP